MNQQRSQESSDSLDQIVADALLITYGYRRVDELRGEYIVESHKVVSNTLHTVEGWERDRSRQSPNPLNVEERDIVEQMVANGELCSFDGRECDYVEYREEYGADKDGNRGVWQTYVACRKCGEELP
jgi:hypothetical protein